MHLNPATLRVGDGVRLTLNPDGASIAVENGNWAHPWTTQAWWWPAKKQWMALVRPGFVNGQCPVVKTTASTMAETPSFLAPVTAWAGAADIKQAAELADGGTDYSQDAPLWVKLYRNPLITIPGWSEVATYPAYFTRRGVTANSGRRLLSCDVVLHKPRLALTSDMTFPVDIVLGSSIVTQTLSVTSATSDRMRVFCIAQMDTTTTTEQWVEQILGIYEEPTYDELLLAKIYLISPPKFEGDPDGSWSVFVAHKQFWNLCWDQPSFTSYTSDPTGTQWIPPLAGGAGSLVMNSLIASINDMTNQALNIVTSHSLAGAFWTPTGGGSSAMYPASTTVTSGSYGLNKSAKLKAAKMASILAGAWTDTLDPDFPYTAQSFSTTILNWQ